MRATHSVTLALSLCASTAAQTAFPRVIHVWVDPRYGDDATALANNPNPDPTKFFNPDPLLNEVALHAPWPFKTIGRVPAPGVPGRGALGYIPALPTVPTGQTGFRHWEYAVIHLLPGYYARQGLQHPDNGLFANGEEFPIRLPPRVSLKGTSALNVLFDLATGPGTAQGPAFEFGRVGAAGEAFDPTGQFTVIDRIAIFGTRNVVDDVTGQPMHASAIYLGRDFESYPTITNCILFGNGVGVLCDGLEHQPRLINNTFAWNHVGVWNGDTTVPLTQVATGWSILMLVNNVFDSSPPPLGPLSAQGTDGQLVF